MNWEAVGAVGEVAGAVAVVVTLLLLLRQIRENTRATAVSTAASYMQAYSAWNDGMSDLESARITRLAVEAPEELTSDESQAYFLKMNAGLSIWESLFFMRSQGLVPEHFWRVVRSDLVVLGSLNVGRNVLEGRLPIYDKAYPDFAAEIRRCMSEDASYTIVDGMVQPLVVRLDEQT